MEVSYLFTWRIPFPKFVNFFRLVLRVGLDNLGRRDGQLLVAEFFERDFRLLLDQLDVVGGIVVGAANCQNRFLLVRVAV